MFGLGLLKGMGVTIRHFVESYVYDRKPWEARYSAEWLEKHQRIDRKGIFTIQYPEQKRQMPENFRFIPMLVYEETPDNPRCTACGICARVCPPQCIWIERATDDKGRPKARPAGFWIDARSVWRCGSCAEYCPFDAIKMNQQLRDCDDRPGPSSFYDIEQAGGLDRILCQAASHRLCTRRGCSPGERGSQASSTAGDQGRIGDSEDDLEPG